jgi:hypothetical protein
MSVAGPSHYFAAMRNFGRDHGIADDYPDLPLAPPGREGACATLPCAPSPTPVSWRPAFHQKDWQPVAWSRKE